MSLAPPPSRSLPCTQSKAMEEQNYGGHEEEFVDRVADSLICHICTKPLRDPHLTTCCGQHFCESCLKQWFSKHDSEERCCPLCRSAGDEFQHVLDKKTRREINSLKVRCANRNKGCDWVGELGESKDHLEAQDGCDYVEVECPNGCTQCRCFIFRCTCRPKRLARKDLQQHLLNECEDRPYQCEYCGIEDKFYKIKTFHYSVCKEFPVCCPNECGEENLKLKLLDKHRETCPLEKIGCPFAEEGCVAN